MSDAAYWWWNLRGRFRHRFRGQHTLIPVEYWRHGDEGEVLVEERGWRCWHCEYREGWPKERNTVV